MQITLNLSMFPGIDVIQTIHPSPMGKMYEFLDYWQHSKKITITLVFNGKSYDVEYCLAKSYFINHFHEGELFGLYFGDMMMVSAEIAQNRPSWVVFIVAKLFHEKQLKGSGISVHQESLFHSIRLVNQMFDDSELDEFLLALAASERTNYVDFDEEFKKFLEGHEMGKDVLLAQKRKYLDRHHGNQWVRKGRQAGQLLLLDSRFGMLVDGFVNHAERIYQCLLEGEEQGDIYLAAQFVRQVMTLEDGEVFEVPQKFCGIAYRFHKDYNNLVSLLVPFHEQPTNGTSEWLVKVKGKSRTWVGLSKRLSYAFHRAELEVQKLIEERKVDFDKQVCLLEDQAKGLVEFKEKVNALVEAGQLEQARQSLDSMPGNHQDVLRRIEQASNSIANSLTELSELSEQLKSCI